VTAAEQPAADAVPDPELLPHPEGVPVPNPSPWSRPYWDGLARGELLFQRCEDCGGATFNPAPICAHCASDRLAWERSAGGGAIYSWTVIWRPQTPAFRVPYAAAIVDVDEGFQVLANLIGCRPSELAVGRRVTFETHPIGEGFSLPYFRPAA
jgi:uncharacterized OB-fold protein